MLGVDDAAEARQAGGLHVLGGFLQGGIVVPGAAVRSDLAKARRIDAVLLGEFAADGDVQAVIGKALAPRGLQGAGLVVVVLGLPPETLDLKPVNFLSVMKLTTPPMASEP
jgi:hypothetical protein